MSPKVSGCRDYISRAEKRFEKASEAAQEAVNQRDALAKDLEDHKEQLEALEKEADRYTDSPVKPASEVLELQAKPARLSGHKPTSS